jgi:GDPmannose 4,6-dehydratase
MKTAFITGITGQDGSYLAEFLLEKNYEVHGMIRRSSVFTTERIDHLLRDPRLKLHHGDLNDSSNILELIKTVDPEEIYHLGAQSHVGVSFEVPEYSGDVSGLGTLRILNAIKSINPQIKLYNASTSEMFGGLDGTQPQSESTAFHPRSPYGAAKLYAHWLAVNYREAFNIPVSNGILFNHESPRRGKTFVTRKISLGVARQSIGDPTVIKLGNLNAIRDWGFAGDYVEAMWKMLQSDLSDDFVIATGVPCSVREFVEKAYNVVGTEICWVGTGDTETGIDVKTNRVLVEVSPQYYRPAEVEVLIGNPEKANSLLGWSPKTSLDQLVTMMVEGDLAGYPRKVSN